MNLSIATLYVSDLQRDVTEAMLMEVFTRAGGIHSVCVCRDWNSGSSLGYAYVNFYQQEDAERALATLNNELLMGQPMRVMWSQKDSTVRKSSLGSLFIKNLDMETIDSMALYDLFLNFGKVLSCKVVAYKKGTKGYGCVQFDSQEAANLAREKLDGKLFNDHKVSIEHFKSREERQANLRSQVDKIDRLPQAGESGIKQKETLDLFVKNLDRNIDDECLRVECSKFGTVTKAKIIMDNGRSRGFGFVRFSSSEEAMRAKSELNGQTLGQKQVFVDVAHQREKRNRRNIKMEDMQIQNMSASFTLRQRIELYAAGEVPCVQKERADVTTPPSTHTVPEADVDTVQEVADEVLPGADTPPVVDTFPSKEAVPEVDPVLPEDNERSTPVMKVKPTSPTRANKARPARKRLTIHMLESANPEEHDQMAYDHLLPLVKKIHPDKADQITSTLLQSTDNYEILNMIKHPDLMRFRVDAMDNVLKAEEAEVKPKEIVDLFVKNLDENIDDECLRMEFAKFGTVSKAKIITDNGCSRGYGFVRFSSSEEAMRAKSELNGQMLGQKQMFVDVALQREKRRRNVARMKNMQTHNTADSFKLSKKIEEVQDECPDVITTPSTDAVPETVTVAEVYTVRDVDDVAFTDTLPVVDTSLSEAAVLEVLPKGDFPAFGELLASVEVLAPQVLPAVPECKQLLSN